jgi:tripartite-type tricarboxylate transporter receptor subunit TctC
VKRHFAFVFALLVSGSALAQTYPTKPIRIYSAFSVGNPADTSLRLVTQKLTESLGQQIIIDPQTAASGVGASQMLMRAAPDGYTLLYVLESMLMSPQFLIKQKPFDPLRDFAPVVSMFDGLLGIVVPANFPAKNMAELIALAKKSPGKYAYGTNGIGGTYHLEMELMKQAEGFDMTQVPYKTSTEAVNALMAGEIPVVYTPLGAVIGHMKAGKVRAIGLMDYKRSPDMPQVPALGEDVKTYQKVPTAVNMYGPAGLPMPIVRRLHADIVKAMDAPDVKARLKEITFFGLGTGPEEMAANAKKAVDIYARAFKAAKIVPQ